MVENHFTATGIVFNPQRKILMILHNKFGVWLPPGGHVDENELPTDAVIREIFEETGVKARLIPNKRGVCETTPHCKELDLPFTIKFEDIKGDWTHNHIDMVFLCTTKDTILEPHESEVDGIGWFSLDEVKQLKTFDDVMSTILKAAEFINQNPEVLE